MEQIFTPSLIFDLLCVALVLIVARGYARKGLASTLVELVGTLASVLGANWFANWAAPQIFDGLLAERFRARIAQIVVDTGSVNLTDIAEQVVGFLPDSFIQKVVTSVESSLDSALAGNAQQIADQLLTQVIQPLFVPVIIMVLFFVAFVLLRMVVSLLANLLTIVNKIPLLGAANQGLGFVGGMLVGLLYLFIGLCAVWALIAVTGGGLPYLNDVALADSLCYKIFGTINPFTA